MQQVWVIRQKEENGDYISPYHISLDGHGLYNKTDDPNDTGLIFGTEKQAIKSLSRYDARYRDNYEIVSYVMVLSSLVEEFVTERYPYEAVGLVEDMKEACNAS
jgi:hypothetical protein